MSQLIMLMPSVMFDRKTWVILDMSKLSTGDQDKARKLWDESIYCSGLVTAEDITGFMLCSKDQKAECGIKLPCLKATITKFKKLAKVFPELDIPKDPGKGFYPKPGTPVFVIDGVPSESVQ